MKKNYHIHRLCGRTLSAFLDEIEKFHGWHAPGLVLGGFMVDLALDLTGCIGADAIVETRFFLPDAIQLFSPCTYGNGGMKVLNWDKFAMSLYDKRNLEGHRVWFDLKKARAFPNLYNWYLRLVPQKELTLEVLIESILEAGKSILSYQPIRVTRYYEKNKKSLLKVCRDCGEAYPAAQGLQCLACQGKGYYEFLDTA